MGKSQAVEKAQSKLATTYHILDETNREKFFGDLLAGGVSTTCAVTLIAPLERIKIIQQVQNRIIGFPRNKKILGLKHGFLKIVSEQGVRSLWRGNLASAIRTFPCQGLNFALKERYEELYKEHRAEGIYAHFLTNFMVGGAFGVTTMAAFYPLEFARSRMALDMGNTRKERQFLNLRACIMKFVQTDGWQGLYSGFGFSVLSVFINRALYFGLYDTTLEAIPETWRNSLAWNLVLGQCFAVGAAYGSHPIDTVKRVMMMQSGLPKHKQLYMNSFHCAFSLFMAYGLKSLYPGIIANIMRASLFVFSLIVYNNAQYRLAKRSQLPVEQQIADQLYIIRKHAEIKPEPDDVTESGGSWGTSGDSYSAKISSKYEATRVEALKQLKLMELNRKEAKEAHKKSK